MVLFLFIQQSINTIIICCLFHGGLEEVQLCTRADNFLLSSSVASRILYS